MSPWLVLVLGGACGATAAVLVRSYARLARTRALWWLAALGAAAAALLGTLSPTPVAAAIGGVGLAAAAVIDAVETRIPASLAHGTTLASVVALGYDGWRTADWSVAWTAGLCTMVVVVVFLALWFAGGMGYGDVRLSASTVTASVGGLAGTMTLLWGAFAAAGLATAVRWQRNGGRRQHVPFAPALAVGWLLAVALT